MRTSNLLRALLLSAALVPTTMACDKDDDATPATTLTATERDAEKAAIQKMLDAYAVALNASNAATIAATFTQDGVFVPPGAPTATGPAQIQATLTGLFGAVTLNLRFTPAQIVVVDANNAYATSTSSGTTLIKANGQTVPSSYRELWVFAKESGQWKIARYLFNQP
jgi:uncharacterized protein (TIGR02246 family)